MRYRVLFAVALASLTLPATGLADRAGASTQQVYGTVLKVEPLLGTASENKQGTPALNQACATPPMPAQSEGLAARLNWDLQLLPEAQAQCQGLQRPLRPTYRVTYEWNGRKFVDVLPRNPGQRIPLTIRIE